MNSVIYRGLTRSVTFLRFYWQSSSSMKEEKNTLLTFTSLYICKTQYPIRSLKQFANTQCSFICALIFISSNRPTSPIFLVTEPSANWIYLYLFNILSKIIFSHYDYPHKYKLYLLFFVYFPKKTFPRLLNNRSLLLSTFLSLVPLKIKTKAFRVNIE